MRVEYSVKDALEYLKRRGVSYNEVYFRAMIGKGKIKSRFEFNSRIVPQDELDEIVIKKMKVKK